MSTEPNTGLTYQTAGSLQTDALQNAELNYYGAWLNCVVLSVGDTAPPGSPMDGDRYIVGAAATGAWATHDDKLAVYRDGWQFYAPPTDGVPIVKNLDDGNDYECVAGVWSAKTGGTAVLADGSYGDVNVSASGTAMTIPNGTVTYAKLQDVSATSRVLGRKTAGAGDAEELTLSEVLDLVGSAANGDILYRSGGAWTRLPVGTNGHVLTLATGLPTWAAGGGGGGLTNFTEPLSTSTPNATIPYVSFTPNNAATSVDVAIVPKGTGAFSLAVANNATSGGNKRGRRSIDLQISRASQGQIPSSDDSFCFGNSNTASGSPAMAIGQANIVSNAYAYAFGQSCLSDGFGSTTYGYGSNARGVSYIETWAGYQFGSTDGSVQDAKLMLVKSTTNATISNPASDSSAATSTNSMVMPNNSAFLFDALVVAREAATGDTKSWLVQGHIKRGANAAATAMVAAATITPLAADAGASAWTLGVSANTTLGAPMFEVTGEAAKTIKWAVLIKNCLQLVG